MPLNETHLGLIGLIFPEAPIIHLLRHPLDVVLSVFSNHLTHGFYCAYDLTSIARHYVLVMDLVEHYRREMALQYMAVRYEDVIDRQDESVRQMLAFVGAPYDRRCLDFHENRRYARTASYAQVTEKLYDRSRYRYRVTSSSLRHVPDPGADDPAARVYDRVGGAASAARLVQTSTARQVAATYWCWYRTPSLQTLESPNARRSSGRGQVHLDPTARVP